MPVFAASMAVFTFMASAISLDEQLLAKALDQSETNNGQMLFEQNCASCHNKDLSGASGFNLKDGEWVHGSKPSQIINNVKNGFMNAGMPGFNAVLNNEQIESIVVYVLSKREGWRDLHFKLYQLNNENDKEITADKLVKSGLLTKGLADFSIPEIQDYFIEFEGDFYAPKDIDTQIWLQWGFPHEVFMAIDGKSVKKEGQPWFPTWRLKRGKQHLKITYRSGTTKPNQRNLVMIGTNLDMTIKLFAVSSKAKAILEGKQYNITAQNKTVIQRKRIHNLPPYSISVGLTDKLNFAFNTKSCSIVGLWQGDMLNIGPNIGGRGEDPSLPLGEWLFHYPEEIALKSVSHCQYKGYQLVDSQPMFSFQLDGVGYALIAESKQANPEQANAITFHYQVIQNTNTEMATLTQLTLPKSNKMKWSTEQGHVEGNDLQLLPNSNKVSLKATITSD